MQNDVYSVTQLNAEVKSMLEGHMPFRNLFVRAEISNYKAHTSGHRYLTLKDENAAIAAVIFRADAVKLRFRLENGMQIIARGRISSFPKSGQVQMYISDIMPDGAGALQLAFEQLKRKLYEEGLFDEAAKQYVPEYPQIIGLITSPTGAAVRDMTRILARRWPLARVQLYPALVQGVDAPADLCRALRLANTYGQAQVLIIGRGGGSIEDLWAFNEEAVARAIYNSSIPVISAVGHEPDVTIADFAADLRAPTPSAAAEFAVPDQNEVRLTLQQLDARLMRTAKGQAQAAHKQLAQLKHRLQLRTPQQIIMDKRLILDYLFTRLTRCAPQLVQEKQRLEALQQRLARGAQACIEKKQMRLQRAALTLDTLSPLKVLSRGYALALDKKKKPITDSAKLRTGDIIDIRFAKGSASCKVIEQEGKDEEKG